MEKLPWMTTKREARCRSSPLMKAVVSPLQVIVPETVAIPETTFTAPVVRP